MKWFCAAMFMLIFLTPMVGNPDVAATDRVETAFSCRISELCVEVTDYTSQNPMSIYLVNGNGNNGDANNNGGETGEEKEKELEADPAGGVDRIWNSVQLA